MLKPTVAPPSVGQLVELVNQPPNYGRSLDGTLARVEWVPKQWDGSVIDSVMVELYRKHRRTGKPLALRTTLMPIKQLKPVAEVTPEQALLLSQVESLRQEQQARREKMKADRLAWQQGILAMAKNEESMSKHPSDRTMSLAQDGLTALEAVLTRQPPEGISPSEVADFFQRHRPRLLEALAGWLKQAGLPEKPPESKPGAIATTSKSLAELQELIDEGEEFRLLIRHGETITKFVITPDVDGLHVAIERGPAPMKLDSTDAAALLDFLPTIFPAVGTGELLAMERTYQDEA